jgi:hypothetical protein
LKRLLGIGALIGCVLLAGGANAALVRTGNLVLTADGGFTPRQLPRRAFMPIDFKGYAKLKAVDGSVPTALQQLVLDFDRDGKLTTAGLPTCDPSRLQEATPQEARSRCRGAIVGKGSVSGLVSQEAGPAIPASSPMTLFNGPPQDGHPTVVFHARLTSPAVQDFVITIPIEKRPGAFRYRATVDIPPIAGGRGALTYLDATIGKRYRFRGMERSYTAARCSDGILHTHGRFTFVDGLIIDGSVEKACTVR